MGAGKEHSEGMTSPMVVIIVAFILLSITLFLVLSPGLAFFEPDEFCYYYSSRNLMEGKWTLSESELAGQREEARGLSPLWPHDLGYTRLGDLYVLVKAPGYSFFLAVLRWFGLNRLGNAMLLVVSIAVFLIVAIRLFPGRVILVSISLFLFTPISLVMAYRAYMSDFAAAIFLFLGGMGVLHRVSQVSKSWWCGLLLDFLTAFCLGFSFVLRFTNGVTIAFLGGFLLYYVLLGTGSLRAAQWSRVGVLATGFILPVSGLMYYNVRVFGHLLSTGYQLQEIRPQDTTFIFMQVARGMWSNVPDTILRNVVVLPEILLSGVPWLILLPPALIWAYRHLERRVFILLAGWIGGILVVYFQYRMLMPHIFVIISRMYLPLIGPAAILIASYSERLGRWSAPLLCLFSSIIAILFFAFFLYQIDVPFLGFDMTAAFGRIQDVVCLIHPLAGQVQ